MIKISATIVIYNEKADVLCRTIEDYLKIDLNKELIIVDNSPDDRLQQVCEKYDGVRYMFNNKNIGFGSGHNLGFSNLHVETDYHFILNPDVYFNATDIKEFVLWMSSNRDISLAVPRVYYPDERLQHTIRNIPTPITLVKRRLNINGIFDKFVKKDEFNGVEFREVTEIPFAHGCFFIFPAKVFKQLNGFDERFFMYMEDVDICMRAKQFGKVVINPNYKIYHEYAKESSKSLKLLSWHIVSAFKFFIR